MISFAATPPVTSVNKAIKAMSTFPVPVRARNITSLLAELATVSLPVPPPAAVGVGLGAVGVTVAPVGVKPPSRLPGFNATTVPIVTAPCAAEVEDLEVWNSVLIAERMLATARPCEQDGMRFLLGMIASR